MAHEWGHHIQNITGQMNGIDNSQTGPDSDGVRLELQADCYAGAALGDAEQTTDENGVSYLEPLSDAEWADALSAASAVGDDHIQEQTQGAGDARDVDPRCERTAAEVVQRGASGHLHGVRHVLGAGLAALTGAVVSRCVRFAGAPQPPRRSASRALLNQRRSVRFAGAPVHR